MKVNRAALLAEINQCDLEFIEISVDVSTCDYCADLRAFVAAVIEYDRESGILFLEGKLNERKYR